MAFILGRQRVMLETDDSDLTEIMSNTHLSQYFMHLEKELDAEDPKTPEDIYKSHLTETSKQLLNELFTKNRINNYTKY